MRRRNFMSPKTSGTERKVQESDKTLADSRAGGGTLGPERGRNGRIQPASPSKPLLLLMRDHRRPVLRPAGAGGSDEGRPRCSYSSVGSESRRLEDGRAAKRAPGRAPDKGSDELVARPCVQL